ncbi:putative ATPase synthesis protein 25 [Seiridium cardinale]
MVTGRVLSAAGCSHCRSSILRLLIAGPATPLIRAPHLTAASWRTTGVARSSARSYVSASHPVAASEGRNPRPTSDELETLEGASTEQEASHATPASGEDDAPWYLQVEPPRHVPVSEPPPLPDVPEGSPTIIPALLKYASEEMGLDELSLLDLRELDPPPALGTNLFMLFGTARSERHLNVSAGRLVRWLRANHRIYADADGLLGPNERKTKLRRKAKRARLLGTMGTDDADDGITTGWVCVNLGTINRSHMESAVVGEDGRVAGFGVPQTGSTIVVQVMTESRRAELGLETLWERALARQSKQELKELEKNDSAELQPFDKSVPSQTPSQTAANGSASTSPLSGQSRFFSTKVERNHDNNLPFWNGETTSPHSTYEHVSSRELFKFFESSTTLGFGSNGSSHGPVLIDNLSVSDASALFEKIIQDGPSRARMMELLRIHLKSVQPADALATLQSTTFRKVSQMAMHNLPAEQTWALRLAIESKARQLGLQEHRSLETTRQLIDELRMHAITTEREEILQLLGCIYASSGPELDEQTSLAMELLECVHLRGQQIVTHDVVVAIIEGMSWSGKPSQESLGLQTRLEELTLQAKLPYMGEPLLIRLMDAYARLRRWDQFWQAWRIPPRYAQPRSEAMYLHVYKLAAATKSHSLCAETIHRCFQEMIMENPPVEPVGAVREAILQCIRTVDPKAEEHADTIPANASGGIARVLVNREYVRLVKELKKLRRRRPSTST